MGRHVHRIFSRVVGTIFLQSLGNWSAERLPYPTPPLQPYVKHLQCGFAIAFLLPQHRLSYQTTFIWGDSDALRRPAALLQAEVVKSTKQ
jgi:hypothetical protein